MQNITKLRQLFKKIAPLYWLVGFARYLNFRRHLRTANLAYENEAHATAVPPMLRYRVHGALDAHSYVEVGRSIALSLVKYAKAQAIELSDATILDFACGPGRIAVELKKLVPSCRLYGSDIDGEAIAWAQGHLVGLGVFTTNEATPPTNYASNTFDVIYSISFFTHLDETSQNLWLAELARILKPGGTLLTTIHGDFARASCTPDELKELDRHGIAFRMDRKGKFKLDGLPDFYQTTFHTQAYVARVWSGFFEVVEHIDGGLGQHQDLVLLKRRTPIEAVKIIV